MKYPFLFYTDRLPDDVAGCANAFVVRIRPNYREDEGLREHEFQHVRQWATMSIVAALAILIGLDIAGALVAQWPWMFLALGAHGAAYVCLRPYRLMCELDAYLTQTQHPDRKGGCLSIEYAAKLLIKPRYRWKLTEAEALELLRAQE